MSATDEQLGLRERKKLRTRETIARVALELFDQQGYAETTIAQIAAAADVSPRTVSGYFPAKDDLVFSDEEESFRDLAERLDGRPDDVLAPQAVRGWIADRMDAWKGREEVLRAQRRVVAQSEALQARHQLHLGRLQSLLNAALADDLGAGPDDLEPRMASAATIAIVELLVTYIEPHKEAAEEGSVDIDEVKAEVLRLLDRTVVFVTAGVQALRESRGD